MRRQGIPVESDELTQDDSLHVKAILLLKID